MIITEADCAWWTADSYITPNSDQYHAGYVNFHPNDCTDFTGERGLHQLEELKYHDNDDCEAYTGRFGTVGVIAIRGTSSLADVDKDRKFKKVDFRIEPDPSAQREMSYTGQGRVCRGDLEYATNIAEDILKAMDQLDVKRIVIVAHSLAGGVAPLVASVLSDADYDVYTVCFNPKRSMDKEAVTAFEHKLEPPRASDELPSKYRIFWFQNAYDIVPHMPPFFFGFRHPRGRRYLTSRGQWRKSIPLRYIVTGFFIGTVYSLIRSMGRDQIGKHSMTPFAETISKYVDDRLEGGRPTFLSIDASG